MLQKNYFGIADDARLMRRGKASWPAVPSVVAIAFLMVLAVAKSAFFERDQSSIFSSWAESKAGSAQELLRRDGLRLVTSLPQRGKMRIFGDQELCPRRDGAIAEDVVVGIGGDHVEFE